jgi:lysophospholipase L1-like esterase
MYRESGINRFNIYDFTTDGVHANEAGDERFAKIIAGAIKKEFSSLSSTGAPYSDGEEMHY